MTVPFGAMDRVGVLNTLYPPPKAQQDVTKKKEPKLTPLEQAQKEMLANGITNDQKSAYMPRISEALAFHVDPFGYAGHGEELKKALLHAISPLPIPDQRPIGMAGPTNLRTLESHTRRNDAWRFYLGLPQQNGTIEVSTFKPSVGTEDKVYYKVKGFWKANLLGEAGSAAIPWAVKELKKQPGKKMVLEDETGVLGRYTLSLGKDEKGSYISYYDKWDLTPSDASRGFDVEKNQMIIKAPSLLGKPFESYDRLYYNPKTFQPIPESKLQSAPTLEEVLRGKKATRRP